MVIGDGLLGSAFAEVFSKESDVIIFASGVSNSQECNNMAFMREKNLLEKSLQNNDKKIAYFSSCSIYDTSLEHTPYVRHKCEMEALVQQAKRFSIFRLPQVVGKTFNLKNLTSFIYKKIITGESFEVWRYAKRNIIDVMDVVAIVKYILNEQGLANQTHNIACPFSISIMELIKVFEAVLNKRAIYSVLDIGEAYNIDTELSTRVASELGIFFDDSYYEKVIRKYYG